MGGRKVLPDEVSHLEHFRRDSVAGGKQDETPGTLLQGFRARWEAEKDTWYTFAGIPCQVGGKRCYLTRFCGDTVPGGRQEVLPDTLLRGFRARWAAGKNTWYTFAGIPCQVDGRKGHLERFRRDSVAGGYMSAGTYCGAPPGLPALRAPSLLGSRCRLRPLYVPVISHDTGLML